MNHGIRITGSIGFLLVFLLFASEANAALRQVGPGKTYSTIQAAVDVAVAGDVIEVFSGTYTDSMTLSTCGSGNYLGGDASSTTTVCFKSSGTAGNPITLKAATGNTVILDGQSSVHFNIYGVSKRYWTIEGLTLRNAVTTSLKYVGSSSPSNLTVKGSSFQGTATNPNDHGIELIGNNSIIDGNSFSVPRTMAIDVINAENTQVLNNTITGSSYSVYFHLGTHGSTFANNTVIGGTGSLTGIFFRDSNNLTIKRNLVKGPFSNYAILYQDMNHISSGVRVLNNTIYCGGGGIGIMQPDTWATTTNNIIYNCGTAIRGVYPSTLPPGQPANNIIYGATYRFYDPVQAKDVWPQGTGNLLSNPLFVNPGTDFTLQPGSPAIDAGAAIVGETYNGTAIDIGAFESISESTSSPCSTVTTSNFSQSAYSAYGAPFDPYQTTTNLMAATCTPGSPNTLTATLGITGDTTRIVYTKGYWYDAVGSAWRQYSGTCTGAINGDWCQGSVSATITDANVSTASSTNPTYFVGMVCRMVSGQWKCGCRDTTCANFYWQIQGAGM